MADFNSAEIGGQFSAVSTPHYQTVFHNPEGKAINAQGAKIAQGVFLHGARIDGMAAFNGAEIGGQFSAGSTPDYQAVFQNPKGQAIKAHSAKIARGVFLHGARIDGMADFAGAEIGGQFSATSMPDHQTVFHNQKGKAINAQGAKIAQDVFLRGARTDGMADFNGAEIGGQFTAVGASLICRSGTALHLQNTKVKGVTFLNKLAHSPIGALNMAEADLGRVVIDENSYPLGILLLDGTRYSHLDNLGQGGADEGWLSPLKRQTRIERIEAGKADDIARPFGYWQAFAALTDALSPPSKDDDDIDAAEIARQARGIIETHLAKAKNRARTPFAYRQLAKVLDRMGHEGEARDIRVLAGAAYTDRAAAEKSNVFKRNIFHLRRWLLRGITGYGAKPWRVLNWLAGAWLLGAIVFHVCFEDMTPAKERYYMATVTSDDPIPKSYVHGDPLPEGYPRFSPIIYALDVMLPIVDIAQETHWRPRAKDQWYNRKLLYFNRIYLLIGWLLTSIGVAGLTGLISDKRDP